MHVYDFLMAKQKEEEDGNKKPICVPNLQLLPFADARRMHVSTLLLTQMTCITFVW